MLSQTAARWVFVLSGAAALLYQIVWQRLLMLFSGSDVYSSTLVIAAFMAGLGLGHLGGGHLADRRSAQSCLRLFALAETAIAAFGAFSHVLFYDVLYARLGPLDLPAPVTVLVLFVALLWPTFFMGVSLPLLARAMTERLDRAPVRIGQLYGLNTLGAAAGALTATWFVLPRFGLAGSLRVGALVNLVCAAVVAWSLRQSTPAEAMVPTVVGGEPQAQRGGGNSAGPRDGGQLAGGWRPSFAVWAVVYGLAGFLALSLEIVWFRLLGVLVKSTAFTFGTLLAVYLGGLGFGSLAGSRFAGRFRRPAEAFLALQGAIGAATGAALLVLVALADRVEWLRTYLAGYEPLEVGQVMRRLQLRPWLDGRVFTDPASHLPWEALLLYVAVPALLVGPATFLMGFSFPVLQRVVQTDFARLGRRVGALLLANITGSAAGTLATGWLALSALGTTGTMRALLAVSLTFPVLAFVMQRGHGEPARGRLASTRWSIALPTVVVAASLWLLPDAGALWSTLHGAAGRRLVFAEDATGLSVLRRDDQAVTVFVNGIGQSWIPYGGVHTALGLLPAFIHPDPKDLAIIGLGSGDTVYAAAGRPQIGTITAIEIVTPQLVTLQRLATDFPDAGLQGLLTDPRIRHVAGDGRLFLMRTDARFDIVEADALRPTSAYSGNLFSDGYFELLRSRLRPNGLAVTWSPTRRVHNAFVRVFPYVLVLPDLLIGSVDPIPFDRAAVRARLDVPDVRAYYERAGIPIDDPLDHYLVELARYGPDFDRSTLTDFNTDLFPRDELDRPAGAWEPVRDE